MKTLQAYLLRQLVATVSLTVAVFTGLLLVGNVLADIFDLIATGRASAILIGKALLLLVPFVLAFSLPIGLLTATLLLFGRLSADQELTAIRASGISPARISVPILAFGAAMAVICGTVNLKLAPEARVAFKALRDGVLRESGASILADGRFIDLGPRITIYAQKVEGLRMKGVLIYGTTNSLENGRTNLIRNLDVHAPEAELQLDARGNPSRLLLRQVQGVYLSANEWQPLFLEQYIHDIAEFRDAGNQRPRISDMTLGQLLAERRRLERDGGKATPVTVQIHRNLSFSFACIAFTLIGIPLGVRGHRRETNFGIAASLGLVAAYYSFLLLGSALDTHAEWHPEFIVWMPTGLFVGTGGLLLWRLNRK